MPKTHHVRRLISTIVLEKLDICIGNNEREPLSHFTYKKSTQNRLQIQM